jgi:hypothetical protein
LYHRYYDPATEQFLSVDPLVDRTDQPYTYAGDDPVNVSDPSGLCNDVQGVHVYDGPCTGVQLAQIRRAAVQARAAGVATGCSNVFSCIVSDPESIVASFNANRGTIEHAEEAVVGVAGVVVASIATAGTADVLLEAGAAAAEEGGFLGAFDTIHLLVAAPFILGPEVAATGAAAYLTWYGINELVQHAHSQSVSQVGSLCQ